VGISGGAIDAVQMAELKSSMRIETVHDIRWSAKASLPRMHVGTFVMSVQWLGSVCLSHSIPDLSLPQSFANALPVNRSGVVATPKTRMNTGTPTMPGTHSYVTPASALSPAPTEAPPHNRDAENDMVSVASARQLDTARIDKTSELVGRSRLRLTMATVRCHSGFHRNESYCISIDGAAAKPA
jgi:hypothetical protein